MKGFRRDDGKTRASGGRDGTGRRELGEGVEEWS